MECNHAFGQVLMGGIAQQDKCKACPERKDLSEKPTMGGLGVAECGSKGYHENEFGVWLKRMILLKLH